MISKETIFLLNSLLNILNPNYFSAILKNNIYTSNKWNNKKLKNLINLKNKKILKIKKIKKN